MAKVTNFLSIALLVSVLAVNPVFAAVEGAAAPEAQVPAAPAAQVPAEPAPAPAAAEPAVQAPVVEPAPAAAAPAVQVPAAGANNPAPSFSDKVAVKTNAVLSFIGTPVNKLEEACNANHATKFRLAKYLAVIGLVASNSAVQAAFSSLISAVQSACGVSDDSADQSDDSNEPTRLTIGRQA